jgi:branched-chain amino acid transport system substrate-binding protein
MKKRNYCRSITKFYFLLVLTLLLSSCAGLLPGLDKDEKTHEKPEVRKPEVRKEEQAITYTQIMTLSNKAEYFIRKGNYDKALAAYDFLFSKIEEKQKNTLISKIEKLLPKIPVEVLQQWLKKDSLHIPKPFLLYFIGVKYVLDNNPPAAKAALENFLSKYPDHALHKKALDILEIVKKAIFSKHTLGCLLPLSGKYAVLGNRALSGVQLALDNLSKKYSTEFKVVFFDTRGDPQTAVEGVKYLHRQNVIGILGPLFARYEAGREAESLKIPIIALTQKQDFPLQGDYLFTNFITPEMQVKTLGNYLFSELGNTRAVILYPDEKYGSRYMELFRSIADEYKVDILASKAYDGTQMDFSEVIMDLKKELENWYFNQEEQSLEEQSTEERDSKEEERIVDCQVIFIPDSPSRLNLILPQLAYNDIGGMYLAGTNLWHDKSLLEGSKGYHRVAVIPDGFFWKSSIYPETQEFVSDYKSTFNTEPQFIEAIAYDTAKILLTTAMDEKVISREDLKNALKGERVYSGATGPSRFDKNGLVYKSLFLLTIENDEFVEINKITDSHGKADIEQIYIGEI